MGWLYTPPHFFGLGSAGWLGCRSDVKAMIDEADKNSDGQISLTEFENLFFDDDKLHARLKTANSRAARGYEFGLPPDPPARSAGRARSATTLPCVCD